MDNDCSFDCKYWSNSNHCSKKKKVRYEPEVDRLGGWIQRARPFINVNGKRQKILTEF